MSSALSSTNIRRRVLAGTAAAGVIAAGLVAATWSTPAASGAAPSGTEPHYDSGRYLVLMGEAPAAAYRGGTDGFRATAPRGAATFDADTAAAQRYTEHLADVQSQVASAVDADPDYHYTTSLNGFAAKLSGDQATQLAKRDDVIAVVEDEMRHSQTWNTPGFLGLSGSAGLWRRLGGSSSKDGAGDGIVAGIIDSGINSDSASFDEVGSPPPDRWQGECEASRDTDPEAAYDCNDKLIGGRFYTEGQGGDDAVWEGEFLSPEDYSGHGSHTASTVAGNSGTPMSAEGIDFGDGSGMAPAAKVVSYKACWRQEGDTGCSAATSDLVAAVDDAVADGVNVINYSISGTLDNPIDPVELAFMYAADAGVFVAASAGNSGPGASTVAHPSPWLTTVAASTHYQYEGTVELGDGQRFVGTSVTDTDLTDTPMVLAVDAPATGADPADAQLCLPGTLDPTAVAGTIVVCDRGVNARVEKSATVAEAGGAGMVLVNTTDGQGLNADVHAVPSVHLEDEAYDAVYEYAATDSPTASILAATGDGSTGPTPPAIADFSSRGPSRAADGDLLKPDISAPGVDVLAAVAPEDNRGHDFDIYSGTSMSSPHVAGLAALIQQKHPRWSPMAVKSAMMTTAVNLNATKHPFNQGAGHVRPQQFLDPGLVFDSDFDDWWDYLAGQGVTYADGSPISDTPIRASNLNTPSVAINGLAGRETVWREVTNVDNKAASYSFSKTGLGGVKVTAKPSTFTIAPGATKRVKLVFERTKAPLGKYASGNLFLKDGPGRHTVRFPAVVRPVGIDAPAQLAKSAERFTVRTKSGVNGTIVARRRGLVPGVDTDGTAQNTGGAAFDPTDPRNYRQEIEVGGPAQTLRIQLRSEYTPSDGEDLDLFLTDADGNLRAFSATGAVAESFTVSGLPAGTYTAHVQAWAVHGGEDSTAFVVRSFQVKPKAAGNWTITPKKRSVKIAQRQRWRVETSGLDAGTPYLGVIVWRHVKANGPDPLLGRTLVAANP